MSWLGDKFDKLPDWLVDLMFTLPAMLLFGLGFIHSCLGSGR